MAMAPLGQPVGGWLPQSPAAGCHLQQAPDAVAKPQKRSQSGIGAGWTGALHHKANSAATGHVDWQDVHLRHAAQCTMLCRDEGGR